MTSARSLCLAFGLSAGLYAAACTQTQSPSQTPSPHPPSAEPEAAVPDDAAAPAAAAPTSAVPVAEGPLPLGTSILAADVPLTGVDGETVTLGASAGKSGLLVIFTCNHCPYVKAWEERITKIGNAWSKKGFGVVAINSNDPNRVPEDGLDGMKARARKLGLEFAYVVDATSDVARTYRATKTPEVYLFDGAGKLVYHGAVDDSANDPAAVSARWLEDALTAVAAGKPVVMPETKAVGCSIKFRPEA